ncbi:hypothetical protein J1614_004884 [Plenodomus biglobosus]|nr:hypothetical protein J1614_004884 [Plenodomus biglobosus]
MSHTPSNPSKPTPSIYPYRVASYLTKTSLPPSLTRQISDKCSLCEPINPNPTPLPPKVVYATILDINGQPIDRQHAPILRRTSSGRLFAAQQGTIHEAELPPNTASPTHQALGEEISPTARPLRRIPHNLPGAIRSSTIHSPASQKQTSHSTQKHNHHTLSTPPSHPNAAQEAKQCIPAPDTPGPFCSTFIFRNGEVSIARTESCVALEVHRRAPAMRVVVVDNLEAFARRSCVGAVDLVRCCVWDGQGLGSDEGAGVLGREHEEDKEGDQEREEGGCGNSTEEYTRAGVDMPGFDVWLQIAGEYGIPGRSSVC